MLAIAGNIGSRMVTTEQRLLSIPLVFMVLVTLAGTVGFAFSPTGGRRRRRVVNVIAGVLHAAAHVALAWAGAWLWVRLPFVDWPWLLPAAAAFALYLPVIALFSAELVAAYLLIASWFRVNINELFAGQGIEDAKCFLRLHIAGDGTLTVYPIAVDRVSRRWRVNPETRPDASWIVPDPPETLHPRLAEPPVVIPR
jgi:hypothetical protein